MKFPKYIFDYVLALDLAEHYSGLVRFVEALVFPKPLMALYTDFFSGKELWERWAKERIDKGLAVEPKLNGFRARVIKKENKIKILFEDAQTDHAGKLPDLTKALDKMGNSFDFDGEMGIINGEGVKLPRIQMMTLLAKKPELKENWRVTFTIFDLIEYNGEKLAETGFGNRRKKLEELKYSNLIKLVDDKIVYNEVDFMRAVGKFAKAQGSEGVVVKELGAPYPTSIGTTSMAKLKNVLEIKVKVLNRVKNEAGGWNYECGIEDESGNFIVLGKTLNTKLSAEKDDILTVQVQEIIEEEDGGIVWVVPSVMDIDKSRKLTYGLNQILDLAKRGGVLQELDFNLPKQFTEAVLTSKGEAEGGDRLNFMAEKPAKLPAPFKVWHHWRGLDEGDTGHGEKGLKLLKRSASVHTDLRVNWGKDYLEGLTLFTPPNSRLRDKLLDHQVGDKIGLTLKQKQPTVWNDKSELDGKIFEPGAVGNAMGKDTYGKMFFEDEGELLPLCIRNEKGKRYYEFVMRFNGHKKLNGIWGVSEESAGAIEGINFLMFRIDSDQPFAERNPDKAKGMPDWQLHSSEEVQKFLI